MPALVAVARQAILQAIDAAGLPVHAVDLLVHTGQGHRHRLFVDANPSSGTTGKRKRGVEVGFALEVDRTHAKAFEKALPRAYGFGPGY